MNLDSLPKKAVIITAPSGAGKTTLVSFLLETFPILSFSISGTTRLIRPYEVNGEDYFFFSVEEFIELTKKEAFIEWEEVYPSKFYGTLKSEIQRMWNSGKVVIFDVDVKGAINLKKALSNHALSIFIAPPSIDSLRERLKNRKTETPETLETRINKAIFEMTFQNEFDEVLINDDLDLAKEKIKYLVASFLNSKN
jgi:guanylate kinase